MSIMATALICTLGALNVWTEPPLARVFPDTAPTVESRSVEARMYAARGERESFQLCVRAGNEAIERVVVKAEPLDKQIGAPDIRRVGYLRVPDSSTGRDLWPDPLLEFQPFGLEADETGVMWVTYNIPKVAKPGTHKGTLSVSIGKQSRRIDVTIIVSDFVMPETPTLRTAFTLDREAARTVYGIEGDNLEAWKPIYDGLADSHLSYSLWDGGELVNIGEDGAADTEAFKEHLAYAVDTADMNTIDVGAGAEGVAMFPQPGVGELQDPLQFYLIDMANWLQEKGWLERAYVEPATVAERAGWQAVRNASFRIKRNDSRIKRLLVAPVHPFLERYEELWATPVRGFDALANARTQAGVSLSEKQVHPATAVAASSQAAPATDGYDGSLFSFWLSENVPTQKAPEWFEVTLPKPVKVDTLKAIWRTGFEPSDIVVRISYNGLTFERVETEWKPRPPIGPFAQTWASATFNDAKKFTAIRLEFKAAYNGGRVGVTELLLGDDELKEPFQTVDAVEPWLALQAGHFPALAADAHPVEARIMPWICHGHACKGFTGGSLNTWPDAWKANVTTQPLVWEGAGRGEDFLFYPGPQGPMPSIRSEALRDGLEDYERLQVKTKSTQRYYNPYPTLEELNAYQKMIERGRNPGESKSVKKNFQGRRNPK